MSFRTLAIDFGTSNSAAAVYDGNAARRIPIELGEETLPTAIFFPAEGGKMRIGTAATKALINGEEGRFMRALKSVLGTPLFHESRRIGGKRQTLADVVSTFLTILKQRAESQTGLQFETALSGRPVHFHSADPERDAQAEADLRACYLQAGFKDVSFMFEPEAAALASHGLSQSGDTGLIVDIGGGTSDFSVFRSEPDGVKILGSHGIRLGGTDFDHAVSMAHAMPLLGHGGQLRRTFGEGLLPVPTAIFVELSTWAKIPFLYNRDTRRSVEEMLKLSTEPKVLGRLDTVLEDELGHELAFAVEKGKIQANRGQEEAVINMRYIERELTTPISSDSLDGALSEYRTRLREAMVETLKIAGVDVGQISSVVLVGGSSLMNMISTEARSFCPEARQLRSEAFTAVVDGLALAAGLASRKAA